MAEFTSSQRRTLERLRDRLRDEEREGFRSFIGNTHERATYAAAVRDDIAALDAAIRALAPTPAAPPSALDASMPARIWLQIDTDGDPQDRDEPLPPGALGDLTWCADQIGGLEVEYIRSDLAGRPVAAP